MQEAKIKRKFRSKQTAICDLLPRLTEQMPGFGRNKQKEPLVF